MLMNIIEVKTSYRHVKIYVCGVLLYHGRNLPVLTNKLRELILKSRLFDEIFYTKQLGNMVSDPLKHYLNIGWKNRLNPSRYFDGNVYLQKNPAVKINPLLHFAMLGRFKFIPGFYGEDPFSADIYEITKFREYQKSRKAKGVIYTSIANKYDKLKQYYYINYDYDYVCFTDDPDLIRDGKVGIWDIKSVSCPNLDSGRIVRYYKSRPELFFPEYSHSIWIDANINILTDYLFKEIDYTQPLQVPVHQNVNSLYHELNWIRTAGFDPVDKVDKLISIIKSDGFPEDYGFTENCIIFRKHDDKTIASVDELWWSCIKNYSRRDQSSFVYCCWKFGLHHKDIVINPARPDIINFAFFAHNKNRT